jgi:hypothetical protein
MRFSAIRPLRSRALEVDGPTAIVGSTSASRVPRYGGTSGRTRAVPSYQVDCTEYRVPYESTSEFSDSPSSSAHSSSLTCTSHLTHNPSTARLYSFPQLQHQTEPSIASQKKQEKYKMPGLVQSHTPGLASFLQSLKHNSVDHSIAQFES